MPVYTVKNLIGGQWEGWLNKATLCLEQSWRLLISP